MDLFELLRHNQTPAQKLYDAVGKNRLDTLDRLIAEGIDVNMRLQRQSGNTAVHVAASVGYFLCIKKLLEAGAWGDTENDAGLCPLFMAVRSKHLKAATMLLLMCPHIQGLQSLWNKDRWSQMLWNLTSDEMMSILLNTIPDISQTRENMKNNLFDFCVTRGFYNSLKVWLLSGYRLGEAQFSTLTKSLDDPDDYNKEEFGKWFSNFQKKPQSLQHHCRLTIRRSFPRNCNVWYETNNLFLPESVKTFVADLLL